MTNHIGDLIESMEQSSFFSDLPKDKLLHILPQVKKVEVPAGQILFNQGDFSDFSYILLKGKLRALLTKETGETIEIGKINPDETIGELGALLEEQRSLTVEAIDDSELLKLPKSILKDLCYEFPSVLNKVSKTVIERSLKTIRLVAHEKKNINISIILPIVQNISSEMFYDKFKNLLRTYDVNFLCCDASNVHEVFDAIKLAETQQRSVFIFMKKWQAECFKSCKEMLSHVYLIFIEGEKPFDDNETRQILYDIKQVSTIKAELILIHPENIKQIANTRRWLEKGDFALHHHVFLNNDADYKRVVRFMTGTAFALVLGGGGAKGLVHLGVLKALIEKGIPIDAVGGTSIGSAVSACYAYSLSYTKTFADIYKLKEASRRSVTFRNLVWPIISLYSSNPATRVLRSIFNNTCIEDLPIPYFAVASNLSEKKQTVHRSRLIWEAIRSSSAIPGIFPPVVYDDQLLFDGGLLNNLPVDVMRSIIGPNHTIIASNLSKKDKAKDFYRFPPVLPVTQTILYRLNLSYKDYIFPPLFETFRDSLLLGSSATETKNALAADILISPNLHRFRMLSIIEADEGKLINIGYNETLKAIEKLINVPKKD